MFQRPSLPRPSATAIENTKRALSRELGDSKLVSEPEQLLSHGGDESENAPMLPDLVVLAETAADIAATLRIANDHGVPVVPRAGGSGKSGGCIPVAGGIVLATIGMKQIVEIDRQEHIAVVEPGLILGDLHAAVEAEGLFYPPDANSLTICALGGNLAENAGGPRAFKYGVTRDYVLGMDVVLMGGSQMSIGRRTKKGVTGYDLVGTVVGSEGTLAVTTRATLRLLPKPEHVITMMVLLGSINEVAGTVSAVLGCNVVPRCIELLDERTLEAVRRAGVSVDARANAMLILELDGDEPTALRHMERVGNACEGAMDILVAQDAAQRERLWAARRALSPTTRKMARFKVSEDVVVPRRHIAELLQVVEQIRNESSITTLSYGHAGDGNLHVNYLWDHEEQLAEVERGQQILFARVIELGGTLSGEHGIGLSKQQYLPLEQSDAVIELQKRIKYAFDPKGLLNPGKIFPRTGHGGC